MNCEKHTHILRPFLPHQLYAIILAQAIIYLLFPLEKKDKNYHSSSNEWLWLTGN